MRMPVQRVAFTHAKIIHIMAGRSRIETKGGVIVLFAGDALAYPRAGRSRAACNRRITPSPW